MNRQTNMNEARLIEENERMKTHISLLLEVMGEKERNRIRRKAKECEIFSPLQDLFIYGDDEQ